MKAITVFTPAYNRAHLLPRLYESLCRQTSDNFEWLIIDDGSIDDTKKLVEKWQSDNKIGINYKFKQNGGMHSAHNMAYDVINTDFNVCIDSDDFMPNNAIEIILSAIIDLNTDVAGIIGLDATSDNTIIGTVIPDHLKLVKLNELYTLHKVRGDKKVVYKTEIVKRYPKYPIYNGERFVPLDYLYLLIDQDYNLKPVNEVLCIVEYQDDGSSRNILQQYRNNPNGFAFSRISRIRFGKTFKEKFKNSIHLVSSAIFLKNVFWLRKTDERMLLIAAVPFGIALNLYIRFKTN